MATDMTTTHAAVTVFVQGGGQADVSLGLDMKVHDAVLNLIPYLREGFTKAGLDTTELDDKTARWQLVKGIDEILDSTKTLGDAGVKSGNKLRLEKTLAKERYPALIDDVPESIARYQIERYKAWDERSSKIAVGFILPILALGATIAAIGTTVRQSVGLIQHIATGSVLLGLALSFIAVSMRVASKKNTDIQQASKPGSVAASSGLILLAGAVATIIPTGPSLWHVIAVSIALVIAAAGLRATTRGIETVTYCSMVCFGVLGSAAGVSLLIPEITPAKAGSVGAAFGMIFLMFASSVALRAANVPTPFVPTLGESYVNPNETADITMLPTSTSTEALQAIINREQQTIDAHNAILGMTAGGLFSILLSLIAVATNMDTDRPTLLVALVIVLLIAMVYRAVSYEDMMTRVVWLAGIVSIAVIVPVTMTLSLRSSMFGVIVSAVVFLSGIISAFVVTSSKKSTSPLTKHAFEIIEFIMYVAVFILVALIIDVYGITRFA